MKFEQSIATLALFCAMVNAAIAEDVASDPDEAEYIRLKKHFEQAEHQLYIEGAKSLDLPTRRLLVDIARKFQLLNAEDVKALDAEAKPLAPPDHDMTHEEMAAQRTLNDEQKMAAGNAIVALGNIVQSNADPAARIGAMYALRMFQRVDTIVSRGPNATTDLLYAAAQAAIWKDKDELIRTVAAGDFMFSRRFMTDKPQTREAIQMLLDGLASKSKNVRDVAAGALVFSATNITLKGSRRPILPQIDGEQLKKGRALLGDLANDPDEFLKSLGALALRHPPWSGAGDSPAKEPDGSKP